MGGWVGGWGKKSHAIVGRMRIEEGGREGVREGGESAVEG